MARLLGIDMGTSGAKALVIDEEGRVLGRARADYPVSTPRPSWSEQDPEDWWRGVCACATELGNGPFDAIGLTGQMHGAVFLDGEGRVLRPAILWNDQRTSAECEEINRRAGAERVRAITRNPPVTGFTAPKVLWLRNHEPETFARVRSVLLPKDYVRFRLTGVLATDVSDASGTGLLDVRSRRWSSELAEALELDPEWFPPVLESWEVSGRTSAGSPVGPGIPVVAGAGDQAAAGVGSGAVEPGTLSACLGTSGVIFSAVEALTARPRGGVQMFAHANGGWHVMGVMLNWGGAMTWFRDTFRPGVAFAEIEAEASRSGEDDVPLFLPYLSGERCPRPAPEATGSFLGLRAGHRFAELARSVYEGVSFAMKDTYRALSAVGIAGREVRVSGGGAQSPLAVQLLADALGLPVRRLEVDEGPAYGAALLAGVGIGVWGGVGEACSRVIRLGAAVECRPDAAWLSRYDRYRSAALALNGLDVDEG